MSFAVAQIPRRRTDELGNLMGMLKLGAIDPDAGAHRRTSFPPSPQLPTSSRNRWILGTVDFQPDIPADSVKVRKNVGVRFGLAAISAVLTTDSALEYFFVFCVTRWGLEDDV
jgi:hypothetical protein